MVHDNSVGYSWAKRAQSIAKEAGDSVSLKLLLCVSTITLPYIALTFSRELTSYTLTNYSNTWMWTYLGISKNSTESIKSAFASINYFTPLFVGILADGFLGKRLTLSISVILLLLCPFFLMVAMLPELGGKIHIGESPHIAKAAMYFIGYSLKCLSGGMLSVEQALAADQFEVSDLTSKNLFFTVFYVMINVASLLTGFFPGLIALGDYNGSIIFGVCIVVGVISTTIYFAFFKRMIILPPQGSVLLDGLRALGSAIGMKCGCVSRGSESSVEDHNNEGLPVKDLETTSNDISEDEMYERPVGEPSWLDRAKVEYGGKFSNQAVEDLKQMLRLMVWTLTQAFGYMCYDQASGANIQQGVQMNDSGYWNANTVVGVSDPVFFIIMSFATSFYISPLYKKCTGREFDGIKRMYIGMLLIAISSAMYAGIEYWRQSRPIFQEYNESGDYAPKHDLSIWVWLLPQFVLSTGEVGLFIGQTEFFYNEAPIAWKSVAVALGTCFSASIASWVEIIFTQALGHWLPTNLDDGRFADYQWIFCGLALGAFFFMVWYEKVYTRNYTWNYSQQLEREEKRKQQKLRNEQTKGASKTSMV